MTDAPFKPIEITVKNGKSTLLVDGHDITNGIRSYKLTQHGPEHAELELDLLIFTQHVAVDRAAVIALLPDEARTALIAVGWTPPPDGEAVAP